MAISKKSFLGDFSKKWPTIRNGYRNGSYCIT